MEEALDLSFDRLLIMMIACKVSAEGVMVHLGKMTLTAKVFGYKLRDRQCSFNLSLWRVRVTLGYKLRDRQCSFNLSLWRVRVTLVAMGKQQCVSR